MSVNAQNNSVSSGKLDSYKQLLEQAKQVSSNSYSPYSKFPVGSAVLCKDGRVFAGCNVENASFGGTICAERSALVSAVSNGSREFAAIAVYCKNADAWPCGICRQFICEFGLDIEIITESASGEIHVMKIAELLPHSFGPKDLEK